MATKAPSYTADAAKLQAAFDAGADLSELEKLIAKIPGFDVLRNEEGTPVQLIQAISYRDAGGKGAYVVPPTMPGDEGAVIVQTPQAQTPEISDTLFQAILRGATDVIRREPSMGLDPENRQAVENLGALGQYLYAPALDIGAGALTTVQAGLEGLARGGGQLMEDIGLLGLIENLTSVKQTPERAGEQLLGFLEAEGLRAPMGYVPGGAMVPQRARPVSPGRMAATLEQAKPVAPPRVPMPTAMERIAQVPEPLPTSAPRAAADIPETPPAAALSFSPRPLSRDQIASRQSILQGETENRVSDLSKYAPRIYRETDFDSFRGFLPWEDFSFAHTRNGTFVSDTPDMALGQGSNRGVLLEFDAEGVRGTVNQKKPAWQLGFEEGLGSEFFIDPIASVQLRENLRAIRIADDAQAPSRFITERRLIKAGWTVTRGDGFKEYTRPSARAPAAAETPLSAAMETLAAPTKPTPPPIRQVTRPAPPPPKPDIEVTEASLARAQDALRSAPDETAVPVEFAGNINLSKLETTEDAKNLVNEVAKSNNQFIEARRGVVSVPEMESLADQVGLENLLGRELGQAMNAEWIIAARRAVAATSEDAISAARRWKENPADENLKNAALEAIMRQAAFQEQLSGATAEIGRAMRAMRETQAADRTDALKAVVGDITNIRDPKKVNELLDLVGSLDDADAAAKFIGDVAKPGMGDKMLEVWINGLLAGPGTHVVNSTSNALTAFMKLPEELLAAGIGGITRSADRVTAREIQKRAVGMAQGTLDGLRAANKVIKGEDLPVDLSKTELIRRESISGTKGKIIRIPSRALEVQDELFKGISRRGELASLAYQKALKEAKGDKVKLERLYQKYLNNPTKAMQKQADEFARYQTFQNDLIGPAKGFQEFVRKHPGFRYLVPFIRTPVNILKYARDRSLLAPFAKSFQEDIRAGGRRRDQAIARLTLGAGITGTIAAMVEEGLVTGGGPSDPGERASLLATGWQPYSFKIGDTYYSYARLEPLSTVIGVSADAFTLRDYLDEDGAENLGTLLVMSVAKNVFDKTFLQGISNFMQAITDPDRYGESYVQNMAASVIPNVFPQIARGIDPTLRQTEGFLDVLQSRTPFLSKMLPARLDAWGDEIVRVGYTDPEDTENWKALSVATNILNPIRQSQVDKSSPVKTEVARLGMKISRPDKTMTLAGVDVELTPEEYASYIKQSGNMAKLLLDNMVQTEAYKAMDSQSKKDLILNTVRKSRSAFRQQTLMQAMQREIQELSQQ